MIWILFLAHQTQGEKKDNSKYLTQLPAQATSSIQTNTPVITIENLGVALTPSDLLASGSQNLCQSVFLKVSKPTWPELPCATACTSEMLSKSKCWYHTNHGVELYAESDVNRATCIKMYLTKSQCIGVIHETREGDPQPETLGKCRRIYAHSSFNAKDPKLTEYRLDIDCAHNTLINQSCVLNPVKSTFYEILKSPLSIDTRLRSHTSKPNSKT